MATKKGSSSYPKYCYPRYILQEKPSSVKDMLPIARERIKKTYDFPALGPVKEGDKILVATYPHQDIDVLEAIKQAMREAGAVKADHIFLTDWGMPLKTYSAADGWREIPHRLIPLGEGEYGALSLHMDALLSYLRHDPDYTSIYVREAGPAHIARELNKAVPGMGDKVGGNWLYAKWENFISRANSVPDELHGLIDRKLMEVFANVAEVHITDPEGTDVVWNVTEEEAQIWSQNSLVPAHILASTFQCLRGVRGGGGVTGDRITLRERPFNNLLVMLSANWPQ